MSNITLAYLTASGLREYPLLPYLPDWDQSVQHYITLSDSLRECVHFNLTCKVEIRVSNIILAYLTASELRVSTYTWQLAIKHYITLPVTAWGQRECPTLPYLTAWGQRVTIATFFFCSSTAQSADILSTPAYGYWISLIFMMVGRPLQFAGFTLSVNPYVVRQVNLIRKNISKTCSTLAILTFPMP